MLGCRSGGGSSATSSCFSSASFRSCRSAIRSFNSEPFDAIDDCFDDLLNLALDAFQLALGAAQAGPLLHSEPVHLPRELAAELLEEVLPHQLVLQAR